MTDKPSPPVGLGSRGRRFWRSTTTDFDPSDSELEILAEVCRTLDNLDSLAASIAENGTMITGSQGQSVVNPALTEVRGQRALLHRLLAALGLKDEEGAKVPTIQSVRASTAGRARWQGHIKVAK